MNIKVLIDFDIFSENKKDNKTLDKNLELLKRIVKIYPCDLFIIKKIFHYLNL